MSVRGLPGGSVIKSLPANAGDTGSIPGQGTEIPTCCRATEPMSCNNWACALQPGNHNYWTHMVQLLNPTCPGVWAPQQEKPRQWEAHAPQLESSPCSPQQKKAQAATKTQYSHKQMNKIIVLKCLWIYEREFLGGPVVRTQRFHCKGWVQSPVKELRSCKACSKANIYIYIYMCVCVCVCVCVYIYKTIINSYSPGNGASQVALVVKNPPANAGDIKDMGPIPGSGRHTGLGNGNSLQYSCLENPMSIERSLVGYISWGCKRVGHNWAYQGMGLSMRGQGGKRGTF